MGVLPFVAAGDAGRYLRLLAVLSSPLASEDESGPPRSRSLDIWGEWERLREAVAQTRDSVHGHGAPWALVRLAPPTAEALRRTLLRREPGYQVVHFGCHGGPDGLLLEDKLGRERLLPAAELAALLRGSGVSLVVLSACESLALGQALIEAGVRCVVAARRPLRDPAAKRLAYHLYGDLALGAPAANAFAQAQRALADSDNLVLLGDGGLRLQLEPGATPAATPCFVLHPAAQSRLFPFERTRGFVGRSAELLQIARWLEQTGRLSFAVSGTGGRGKTTLVAQAALRGAHRFVALAFTSAKDKASFGPIEVVQALNEALGTPLDPREEDNLEGAIADRLNRGRVLLVLDNLETVEQAQLERLAIALRAVDPAAGSRVLMTLRPRERDPLTRLVDRTDRIVLPVLERPEALRLAWTEAQRQGLDLVQRGAGGEPAPSGDWEQMGKDAALPATLLRWEVAILDEIAALAFRHPALLKLAVGQVAELGLVAARRRLERLRGDDLIQAMQELIGQMVDDMERRSPGATDVLYASLPFVGGATVRQLRRVTLGQDVPDSDDVALQFEDRRVRPAVRANLLAEQTAGGRLELDAPVRAFLEQVRPVQAPLRWDHALRHAEAFADVVRDYESAIGESRMGYSTPLEWSNVSAALDWLSDQVRTGEERGARSERAARLLIEYASGANNVLRNHYDSRRQGWLSAVVEAARKINDRAAEALARKALGDVHLFRDELEEARASYNAALTLYRSVGDRLGEANVLQALGHVHQFLIELEEARTSYNAALTLFRAVGSQRGEANVLQVLGDVHLFRDELEEARASYNAALTLYRSVGSRLGEASVLKALGDVHKFRQEMEEARASYNAALTLYRSVGSRLGEANVLSGLGRVALLEGHRSHADGLLAQAVSIYEHIGDRYSIAAQTGNFGWTLRGVGDVETARDYLLRAADLFEQAGMPEQVERHRLASNSWRSPTNR